MGLQMCKKLHLIIILSVCLIAASTVSAQVKLAQTGLKFLSVEGDARASAIGGAVTAMEYGSNAMFYNPAGMAAQSKLVNINFGNTQWIADINYLHLSASVAPFDGDFGVFGVSIASVDYGEFKRTIRVSGDGGADGYVDLGTYKPAALAVGIGYAKQISEKFSVGGNVKYVYQDLSGGHVVAVNNDGSYSKKGFDINVMAFDFGILYKTGFKSLNFGMSLRNFSQEIEYIEESFQLPLTFKIGLSMNVLDLFEGFGEDHRFTVAVDASHPRDYKEQVHLGAEYTFMNTFSLRAGYVAPTDEQGITAGAGLKKELVGVLLTLDYSYLDFGVFDNVHRFTIGIAY